MATRFYYVANVDADFNPGVLGGWFDTSVYVRRNLSTTKDAATETVSGRIIGNGIGAFQLAVQLISPPLAAGQNIFSTVTGISRSRELSSADNIQYHPCFMCVVDSSGNLKQTLVNTISSGFLNAELATSFFGMPYRNNSVTNYIGTSDGDRIVVEFGFGAAAGTVDPDWETVLGGSGTDYGASIYNNSGTVPWIEFLPDFIFVPPSTPKDVEDIASAIESITISASLPLIESGAVLDEIEIQADASLDDFANVSDGIAVAANGGLQDTGSALDSVSLSASVSLLDSGSGADALQVPIPIDIDDSGSAVDDLVAAVSGTLADGGTADTILSVQASLGAADHGSSAADSLSAFASVLLGDAGTAVDAPQKQVGAPFFDTSIGADDLEVSVSVLLTDSGSATDQCLSDVSSDQKSLVDSGAALDFVAASVFGELTDSGQGTESITANIDAELAESATSAEFLSVDAAVLLEDAAFGDQSILVPIPKGLTDSGTAASGLDVSTSIYLSDLAVGIEVSGISADLMLADLVNATDFLGTDKPVVLVDTGVAVDSFVMSIPGSLAAVMHLGDYDSANFIEEVIISPTASLGGRQGPNIRATISKSAMMREGNR